MPVKLQQQGTHKMAGEGEPATINQSTKNPRVAGSITFIHVLQS